MSGARRSVAPRWGGALLGLLLLSVGCGPTLVWHGHLPDRSEPVALLEEGGRQHLKVGDVRDPAFDHVGFETITFSPDGERVAYAASEGEAWFVVVDGAPSARRWDGVAALTFSPDGRSLAYAGLDAGEGWRVARDDVVLPARFDALMDGTLTFSADGERLAWVGQREGCTQVYVDGEPGPCWDQVADLSFAPTPALPPGRATWGYLARSGHSSYAVINGQRDQGWDGTGGLIISATGRAAWKTRIGGRWSVALDGDAGPLWDRIEAMSFAPGGDDLVYVAHQGRTACVVVRRGSAELEGERFVEIRAESLVSAPDGELAYVARRGQAYHVVRGGRVGPGWSDVGGLTYADRGHRLAYSARGDNGVRVVLDGSPLQSPPLVWAGTPVFGPRPDHLIVAVHTGETMAVLVHRGQTRRLVPFDVVQDGSLAFGPAGEHWGAVVGVEANREIYITIDGKHRRPFDMDEVAATLLQHAGGDGSGPDLQAWVRAEVALYAREQAR